MGNVVIITHVYADLDGYVAIEKLKRFSEIPGIKDASVIYWDGEENSVPRQDVVFVDVCPQGVVSDPENNVWIFDHHPHSKWPGETSNSLVDKFLELDDEKNEQLTRWAYRADFRTGGDKMNIAKIVKLMHTLYSDAQIAQWLSIIIDAHFDTEQPDLQQGRDFFKNLLERFLSENEDTPAKAIFQSWLKRIDMATEDKMNIVYATAKNLMVFSPEKTAMWLKMVIESVDKEQRLFREARKDLEDAEKTMVGRRAIILGHSLNPKFSEYCRSDIAKSLLPRAMQGKGNPIVVQFQGQAGFQIFSNKLRYNVSDAVAALRVEILRTRNKRVPRDWKTLKSEGTLPGTDPLYYNKADYEIVMWGSLTRPSVRPMDISQDTVKRAVITALDPDYFPPKCQRSPKCIESDCPLYPWRLARCNYKRKNQTH